MRVETVTMHNYGSFRGLHRVRLAGRGLVFVRGENLDEPRMESNGAGKSTLFDAVDWALYGRSPRGGLASSVVNEEAGGPCWVVLHLTDGDSEWHVYRHRASPGSGGGVRLFEGGEDRTALDERQTTAMIESVVGMDRSVFHAAVYRQQGDTFDFAQATDGERKKLLTRLIPELEECDTLRDRAAARLAEVRSKLDSARADRRVAAETLESVRGTDVGQLEQAWRAHREGRERQAGADLDKAASDLEWARSDASRLGGLEDELADLVLPEVQTPWAHERSCLSDRLTALSVDREAASQVVDRLIRQVQDLDEATEGPCPRCRSVVTGDHLERERALAREELVAAQADRFPWDQLVATAREELSRAEGYERQEAEYNRGLLADHHCRRGALEVEISRLRAVDLDAYEVRLDAVREALDSVRAEEWSPPGDSAVTVRSCEERLAASDLEVAQREVEEAHWSWWVDALGNRGVKSYVIDSRVEVMTEAANAWVQALTGGTFWVRFETQTATAKGDLVERVNVRVFRHNPDGSVTDRDYRSWSGGEKKRVALGVDQGLAELVARRARVPWGLYVVDESFRQHMDSGGREAVFDLLRGMDRDSVFVVDHDKEMGGSFEDHLVVRVKDRRSCFPEEPLVGAGSSPEDFLPGVATS